MPARARRAALVPLAVATLAAGCANVPQGGGLEVPGPLGVGERIPIAIDRPAGPGPFPAVVIMHDCSGLGPQSSGSPARWSRELVARGFLVARPDSFGSRGFPSGVCTDPSPARARVSPGVRVRDAYAALAHVRALPDVDGRRVGLMGGSHGGSTTLAAMAGTPGNSALAGPPPGGFAAAVALYPGCQPPRAGTYRPLAPLLILAGGMDDWTPARPCEELARAAREAGHAVSIKVYPQAHHAFDSARPVRYVASRMNANATGGRGATTGGNAQAWADSIREVTDFFGRHLAAR